MKHTLLRKISAIALFLGLGVLLFFSIMFYGATLPFDFLPPIDSIKLDHFGSLIGGLVGALFSLASILLLIYTIQEQEINAHKQKVESRFFELLKTHRDNLNEIQIGGEIGKYAIQMMVRELRTCIEMAEKINERLEAKIEEMNVLNFGYLAFYFGCAVVPNQRTTRVFRQQVKNFDPNFVDKFVKECSIESKRIGVGTKIKFKMFLGHQIRLSTYFRHLYQTVKYINNQPSHLLSYSDKYEYLRLLRAQFSPHEQVLLFHHSMSDFGAVWEKKYEDDPNKQLITKYNLIRNVFHGDERMFKYFPCVEFEGHPIPECKKALHKKYW